MQFNSLTFVAFFSISFAVYWLATVQNRFARNLFLLSLSYLFYAFWDWRFLGLIILSSAADFFIGKAIHHSDQAGTRKHLMATSLLVNLGLLLTFKYYNFFVESLDALLLPIGISTASAHLEIVLPVGISFYTFQTLSYTLDIYHKKLEPTKDWLQFFAFVSFFPQLVAGPIERARDLLPQFNREKIPFESTSVRSGLLLAMWGLFKKVVIADRLAIIVDSTFDAPEGVGGAQALWAVLCFTGQLYLDFSAYSDIAIGISRMLGFQLSVNFRRPYFSRSFSDFWRRWHITLSSWFRDYLFIPLGGSRTNAKRTAFNIMIVFLVSGLWHGASWNFVIWGGLNGLLLILVDPLLERTLLRAGRIGKLITSILVTFAWALTLVFFRAETFLDATILSGQIFTWAAPTVNLEITTAAAHKLTIYLLALLMAIEGLAEWRSHLSNWLINLPRPIRWSIYCTLAWSIMLLGAYGIDMDDKQFIYFQF